MTDAEFWDDVYHGHIEGDPEPDEVVEPGTGMPCTECGEVGPCGYDVEGRPMFHRQREDEE